MKNELPVDVDFLLTESNGLLLYLLSPYSYQSEGHFYHREILAEAVVQGEDQDRVRGALHHAVEESNGSAPHSFVKYIHAIRAVYGDDKLDVLISYAEGKAIFFLNGKLKKEDVRLTDYLKTVIDDFIKRG